MLKQAATIDFDLDRYLERIRAFRGERFQVDVEVTVADHGRDYPLLSVCSRAPAPKTLLVLAGVHGDELAGLLAVPEILESWRSEHVRLVVLTPVNPVGAARRSRGNARGHDINRDFVRFATPEARVVRRVFERVRPDFVLSLHEGPQQGTFMFTNRFVGRALATALCAELAAGGTVLAEKDYFGRRLRPPGLAPASTLMQAVWTLWARAFRSQASIAYSQERTVPEIVLESSWWHPDQKARIRPHVALVDAVAQRL